MSIEILLMSDVKDLGVEGDVVSVNEGYARNYLLPKNLGAPVTEATRRRLAKLQVEREAQLKDELGAATERAKKFADASCTIAVKIGDDEQLYGSVSAGEIVDALNAQGLEVEKHDLLMDDPIKELGVFDVRVRLHPEVEATTRVWVVEE